MYDMHIVLRAEVENGVAVRGRKPLEPVAGPGADQSGGGGRGGGGGADVREVEVRVGTVESPGSLIVGQCSLLCSGKRAEPEAGALLGLADLGHPFTPGALADTTVLAGGVLRAALAAGRALLPWPGQGSFPHVIHFSFFSSVRRE